MFPGHATQSCPQLPRSKYPCADTKNELHGNDRQQYLRRVLRIVIDRVDRNCPATIVIQWLPGIGVHVEICQARAGDMAPDLGTKLETDSGISGQSLRTGCALLCDDANTDPRVDAEVCRRLGLRSLAVVPVGRRPNVSGVLEAFSALPSCAPQKPRRQNNWAQ